MCLTNGFKEWNIAIMPTGSFREYKQREPYFRNSLLGKQKRGRFCCHSTYRADLIHSARSACQPIIWTHNQIQDLFVCSGETTIQVWAITFCRITKLQVESIGCYTRRGHVPWGLFNIRYLPRWAPTFLIRYLSSNNPLHTWPLPLHISLSSVLYAFNVVPGRTFCWL